MKSALILLAAPLLLGLAACSQKDEGAAAAAGGAPIAKIAPPAGKAWADVITQTADGDYVMGNPKAPLKLIEFASLTCSHCAEFSEKGLPRLRDEYIASGRVSLEFRNFIRDPFDATMAMLTRCGSPENYFALTEQVYANQAAILTGLGPVSKALQNANVPQGQVFSVIGTRGGLVDFFAARGIAKDQAAMCLAKAEAATKLADGVKVASEKYNITGTPSFILNGTNIEVAAWETLEPILQKAGAR
jgi:protein-disulfide isomerase